MTFIPPDLYREIYGTYVPRTCVDVAVFSAEHGCLLTRRKIPPVGIWHLPGGLIYKGEHVAEAAKRHVKKETNLDIEVGETLGVLENLSEQMQGGGAEIIEVHNLMIVVRATPLGYDLRESDASFPAWFKQAPMNIWQPYVDLLLVKGLIKLQ